MPSRDPPKGYQATYADFFECSMSAGSEGKLDGNDESFHRSDFIAKELWDHVNKLISISNDLMKNLSRIIGVPEEEILPFCREFTSLIDLHNEYIKFCSVTFKYDDVTGADRTQNLDISDNETVSS